MDISKIRGQKAELLVKHMFEASGVRMFRTGIEYMNPEFFEFAIQRKKMLGFEESCEEIHKIFTIPDFMIHDGFGYEFVEVKSRILLTEENLLRIEDQIKAQWNFWRSSVILITSEEISGTGRITVLDPVCTQYQTFKVNYMTVFEKDWGIDPDIFVECEELAKQLFDGCSKGLVFSHP